jgi:hypothetical protein
MCGGLKNWLRISQTKKDESVRQCCERQIILNSKDVAKKFKEEGVKTGSTYAACGKINRPTALVGNVILK